MQLHVTSLILGALLCIAGGVVLWWALWKDRAKGRLRCPKCWYTLEGLPVVETAAESRRKCPECGHVARTPCSLQKTRRRWRWALAGVLLPMAGVQMALVDTPGRQGWWGLVPTAALLVVTNDFNAQTPRGEVLRERLIVGVVMPWDSVIASAIELHRATLLWDDALTYRDHWPVGVPVKVEAHRMEGVSSAFEGRVVTLHACDRGSPDVELYYRGPGDLVSCFGGGEVIRLTLPAPVEGDNFYQIDVHVKGRWFVQRSHRLTLVVRGETHFDKVMKPERHWLTDCVRKHLVWSLRCERGYAWVDVDFLDTRGVSSRGIATALRCEFSRNGQPLWPPPVLVADPWTRNAFPIISYPDDGGFESVAVPITGIEVRVVSDPETAAGWLQFDRYWDGEVRVALRDIPLQVDNKLWDVSEIESVPMHETTRAEFVKGLPEVSLDANNLPNVEPATASPTP